MFKEYGTHNTLFISDIHFCAIASHKTDVTWFGRE